MRTVTTPEDELADRADTFDRVVQERDVEGARAVLDEGYALVLVQPSPATMPSDRWLAVLPDYVVHAYDVQERIIDVDGDVAAILQRVEMTATVLGADRSGVFFLSDVWRRRDGDWRVWRRHSSPLSAGAIT